VGRKKERPGLSSHLKGKKSALPPNKRKAIRRKVQRKRKRPFFSEGKKKARKNGQGGEKKEKGRPPYLKGGGKLDPASHPRGRGGSALEVSPGGRERKRLWSLQAGRANE